MRITYERVIKTLGKEIKFSIITATWNRCSTLDQAIASLASQSFDNYEHIIQDGGSTDGTFELLNKWQDPRRKVVSGRDLGIYDALNKAFERCSGDVIGLLHSDDLYAHPNVLSKVAEQFFHTDAEAVYGDLDYVAAGDISKVIRHWESGYYHSRSLRTGWMPPHPALFLRRAVIERLGGYDTSFRIAADYDSILRYFGKGGISASYIPDVLVKMRVGGESNRSIAQVIRKSSEDLRALRKNEIGGFGTLSLKNLRKISQFVKK